MLISVSTSRGQHCSSVTRFSPIAGKISRNKPGTLVFSPKAYLIVPNARHIDLYDRTDMIPFDKLERFFTDYLKSRSTDRSVAELEESR